MLLVDDTTSPLFGVCLDIPPGALTRETTLTIREAVRIPETAPSDRQIFRFVNVQPDGLEFQVPATLTLLYPDDDGDGIVDGLALSESFISPVTTQDPLNPWQHLAAKERDGFGNRITVEITHLSIFGLLAQPKLESPPVIFLGPDTEKLGPHENAAARETIRLAMTHGPWKSRFDCLGWQVTETDDRSQANVLVEWGALSTIPNEAYLAQTVSAQSPPGAQYPYTFTITINENFIPRPGYHLDPTTAPIGFDLYSVVAHELAHTLGLPGDHLLPNLPRDASCNPVLSDPTAVVSVPLSVHAAHRTLTAFDEAFFSESYPILFRNTRPRGAVSPPKAAVEFEVESTCARSALDPLLLSIRVTDSTGTVTVVDSSSLTFLPSPDGRRASVIAGVPLSLPEGLTRVVAVAGDECRRLGQTEWQFEVSHPPNASIFSGTWSGSLEVEELGDCGFAGPDQITMVWSVGPTGAVSILDSLENTWTGTVVGNVVQLTKPITVDCFGEYLHSAVISYSGEITASESEYRLQLEAVEPWCPDDDCTFGFKYDVALPR